MPTFIPEHGASLLQGLSHVRSWLEADISDALANIHHGKGNRFGSLAALSRNAQCRALTALFESHNIDDFKNWAFLAASIDKLTIKEGLIGDYLVGDLCWALLSDCEKLIKWYSESTNIFSSPYFRSRINDPSSWPYYRYQAYLAMRGELAEVGKRAKNFLSTAQRGRRWKNVICEYQFQVALAEGNLRAMEESLHEMVLPARRRSIYDKQNGLTCNMLEQYATVYAKIAWRNGFEVNIESPWIPQKLLPVEIGLQYSDPWGIT